MLGTQGLQYQQALSLPPVCLQYLFDYHCSKPEGDRSLKIGQLNAKLDELVEAKGDTKVGVLRWLVTHSSSSQMRWILQIILKDMKVRKHHVTAVIWLHALMKCYRCYIIQ